MQDRFCTVFRPPIDQQWLRVHSGSIRCSFSYRSPGLGVIQNSTVELIFNVRVTSSMPITLMGQMGPQVNLVQVATAQGGSAQGVGFNVDPQHSRTACAARYALEAGMLCRNL